MARQKRLKTRYARSLSATNHRANAARASTPIRAGKAKSKSKKERIKIPKKKPLAKELSPPIFLPSHLLTLIHSDIRHAVGVFNIAMDESEQVGGQKDGGT